MHNRLHTKLLLADEEVEIKEASTGKKAPEILENYIPDLITISKCLKSEIKTQILYQNDSKDNYVIDFKKLDNLPLELKKDFENELFPMFLNIKQIMSVEDLKKIALKIEEISDKYEIQELINYSEEFNCSINNFNLDRIKKMLKNFEDIYEIIKKVKKI